MNTKKLFFLALAFVLLIPFVHFPAKAITDLWGQFNNNIYNLNSGNVGIGTSVPSQKLELHGGFRLISSGIGATKPFCTTLTRGVLWFTLGQGSSGPDKIEVCLQTSSGAKLWFPLTGSASIPK